ncbi:hypothetical protein MKW98_020740 [Papaver atlanticum]|uniref:Uncharacterized protein n=1 Tax=Papaver atlanticum TaxID=357466 RepID=A0AAD4TI86_9MAGN|nr:hypothetical protein MKW98_020740 [Papaver atlanticum]
MEKHYCRQPEEVGQYLGSDIRSSIFEICTNLKLASNFEIRNIYRHLGITSLWTSFPISKLGSSGVIAGSVQETSSIHWKTLSLPPLIVPQTDQKQWFQLGISCYALSLLGGISALPLKMHEVDSGVSSSVKADEWRYTTDKIFESAYSLPQVASCCFTAYVIVSTNPVSHLAIAEEDVCDGSSASGDVSTSQEYVQSPNPSLSSDDNIPVRDEISRMIIKSPSMLLEGDSISHHLVNVFTSLVLELSFFLIFNLWHQHHQQGGNWFNGSKKKDVELPAGVSEAPAAAKRAITTAMPWTLLPCYSTSSLGFNPKLSDKILRAFQNHFFQEDLNKNMK